MRLSNSLQQQLQVYSQIESELRRAANEKKPISMSELRAIESVKAVEKSPWQVRDLVDRLVAKGFINQTGRGREKRVAWNLDAPPFTELEAKRRKAGSTPSEVVDAMVDNVVVQPTRGRALAVTEATKEIELVVAGVTILVSRNPLTGRPRVVIDG